MSIRITHHDPISGLSIEADSVHEFKKAQKAVQDSPSAHNAATPRQDELGGYYTERDDISDHKPTISPTFHFEPPLAEGELFMPPNPDPNHYVVTDVYIDSEDGRVKAVDMASGERFEDVKELRANYEKAHDLLVKEGYWQGINVNTGKMIWYKTSVTAGSTSENCYSHPHYDCQMAAIVMAAQGRVDATADVLLPNAAHWTPAFSEVMGLRAEYDKLLKETPEVPIKYLHAEKALEGMGYYYGLGGWLNRPTPPEPSNVPGYLSAMAEGEKQAELDAKKHWIRDGVHMSALGKVETPPMFKGQISCTYDIAQRNSQAAEILLNLKHVYDLTTSEWLNPAPQDDPIYHKDVEIAKLKDEIDSLNCQVKKGSDALTSRCDRLTDALGRQETYNEKLREEVERLRNKNKKLKQKLVNML